MSSPENIKQCCARLYESDFAKLLLGDSFHPGGTRLTERLGVLLELAPQSRVLDIAAGKGTSAFFLAQRFGCEVTGVDYSRQNVEQANEAARVNGAGGRTRFEQGDAERLPFPDSSFDAVICECAFCIFPDKPAAAREFARVLRPGGRVGLSDLTREAVLPKELDGLLAWIACIADAQPVDRYVDYLVGSGFHPQCIEEHDYALLDLVHEVRMKLLGTEIMVGLRKLDLPDVDLSAAKEIAQAAVTAIRQGTLGYAIVCAAKAGADLP
jgi:ubiquinone/menaquinone biosynthesis C-methylase UbiE